MNTMTVTFHHTCNYGAVLQAYALQKTLNKMGHENIIFEYSTNKERKNRNNVISMRGLVRAIISNIHYKLHKKENIALVQSFEDFHTNNLRLTKEYSSMDELSSDYPEVDALITGSDQVFNLKTMPQFVPARLLQFGPDKCIRFSYAASLEKKDYTDEQKKYMSSALARFKGISIREKSAKEYFESFVRNKNIIEVLDPIFLLDNKDWEDIMISPRINGPYILIYQVQRNNRIQEVANYLKKQTGYSVVSINNSYIRWMNADKTFYDVSPEEFLGFYKNAAIVIAASFHGVAFALKFGKPVYAMTKKGTSSRIHDLMCKFGLEDFCIDEKKKIKKWDANHVLLDQILVKERKKSFEYLRTMLSNEDKND